MAYLMCLVKNQTEKLVFKTKVSFKSLEYCTRVDFQKYVS